MQDPAVTHLVNVLLEDQRTRYSGGIERFLAALATDAGRKAYEEWSSNAVTRLFLDALKSYAETCMSDVRAPDPQVLASTFGCLCGIQMAARLIEDPTRVFPSVFDGAGSLMNRKTREEVEASYSASPEDDRPPDDKE